MALSWGQTILPIVSSGRASRGAMLLHLRPRHPIGLGDIGVGGGDRIGPRGHGPHLEAVERGSTAAPAQPWTKRRPKPLSSRHRNLTIGRPQMRILGVAVAGVLALTAPTTADAGPAALGFTAGAVNTNPTPAIVLVRDGSGSEWHHPVPGSLGGGWHQETSRVGQWKGGWCPPHWGATGPHGAWGPYPGPGVPTYWVWGPSGGAFDYPFADWRGPTGGWGNP